MGSAPSTSLLRSCSRIDYDVWGKITASTNLAFQPFGFAGGLRDDATGLTQFGFRDYDPLVGRWVAKDPIGFFGGNSNLYSYSSNDPVNFRDPNGLLVSATYTKSTGQLFVVDKESGKMAFIEVYSGGNPWGEPIPDGVWEILEREGKSGFFRLDAVDEDMRNDIHDPTGRNGFRLHHPGRSLGCVTASDWDDWGVVEALINSTTTDYVEENFKKSFGRRAGGTVKRYGYLRVVP